MTDDKLAFLDAPQTAAPQAESGTTPAPVPAPAQEPPKTDAPAAPAPGAPAIPGAEPPKTDANGHTVPLPKYLDTYNENRDLKKRLADFERSERERAQAQQAKAPDPVQDPQGYQRYMFGQFQQQTHSELQTQRFNMSEQMARQHIGDAEVTEAFKAFEAKAETDPYLAQRIVNSQHPYAEMVKWHKQEKLLSDIGEKPDDWVMRRYAEINAATLAAQNPAAAAPAAAATPPTPAPIVVAPPPSLSRAPASAKPHEVAVGPGQAFDQAFG